MESYIADVKCLQQFMEDGSFLMPEIPAALRALQALGAPDYMDYDFLMSITGMAVALSLAARDGSLSGAAHQAVFSGWNRIRITHCGHWTGLGPNIL